MRVLLALLLIGIAGCGGGSSPAPKTFPELPEATNNKTNLDSKIKELERVVLVDQSSSKIYQELPEINLDGINEEVATVLVSWCNKTKCPCGCGFSFAACRNEDKTCSESRKKLRSIVNDLKKQKIATSSEANRFFSRLSETALEEPGAKIESDEQGDAPGVSQERKSQPQLVLQSVKPKTGNGGRVIRYGVTREDLRMIRRVIPPGADVAPVRFLDWTARYGGRSVRSRVVGCNELLTSVFPIKTTRGRFIGAADVKNLNNVAVLGTGASRALFPGQDPIGKNIRVRDQYFLVIGQVTTGRPSIGRGSDSKAVTARLSAASYSIYVPVSTHRSRFGGSVIVNLESFESEIVELHQVWILLDNPASLITVRRTIAEKMKASHEAMDWDLRMMVRPTR